ncbi:uncharacterized protein [Temnothorax nylanderi]|uniref:uncharacterized protein n=1 Tax=Temnothorax nylanderi TaxID=102681 RepID=UPI003A85D78A
MSTVQKVLERCRRALLIETVEDMEAEVKIDEAFFTAIFSSGETINLSKKSLKDEWEDLRAELASAKQKHKPDSGDARSSKKTEAKVDRDNITESDEERLLADPDGGTTEEGPGENEDRRKDSNDSVEQENNQSKEQALEKPMQTDNGQNEKMVNFERRLDNKIQHLERMMSTTINLHSKMQDNFKLWLRQRELDDERAKKPRIESIVTLSPNSKITTEPRTLAKTTSTLNDG